MPRRAAVDNYALAVGTRIREIREDEGLTIQELADTSKLGSKGHLSNVERGLVRPNIQTLKQVADGLGVLPLDLLTFPKQGVRQKIIELTRELSVAKLREALQVLLAGSK